MQSVFFMSVQHDNDSKRENKIMNAVINTSIILMSTLMDGFAEIVVGVAGAMGSGMAEMVDGENTQKLDDYTLAQYTYLLLSEDATFGELFSALGDWLNSLPQLLYKK
jgi:hypothetical protein